MAGPFDQSLTGFDQAADASIINEPSIIPFEGKTEKSGLAEKGTVLWRIQSIDDKGYLDFNAIIGHTRRSRNPEKLWYAIDAFASATLYSEQEKDVKLLVGSNSRMKIWLNGDVVCESLKERGARADQDTVMVKLQKGENRILVRVDNSQNNLIVDWFGGMPWGWGFFFRIVNDNPAIPADIRIVSPVKTDRNDCELESTFFFKKEDDRLLQRIDVNIHSSSVADLKAQLTVNLDGNRFDFDFNNIRCGENRRVVYLPALQEDRKADYTLKIDNREIKRSTVLKKQNRYELYVVMTSHMDIGYTNTQPVVKERHIQTMLDVLEKCRRDPEFHWTVETTWILDVFESVVSPAIFDEFMNYVKEGRIGISPLYTNPYTGWIGTEEMVRSFDKAAEYHQRYDIDFPAAMVNDLPGVSWILPQMLKKTGTGFLACGINEIYSDYRLQRELPKVFYWEGADDSRVLTCLTNAYTEGRYIGLEKTPAAVEQLLWVKLNRLQADDYPYEIALVNAAFSDNAGIPVDQYNMIKKWNSLYAYPRLRPATLREFAAEFERRYAAQVPVLKGDWTSDWDIFYQSEPQEFIRLRKIQHQLLSAEKLMTINWLLNSSVRPQNSMIRSCYELMLNFSGHGSGLEFGFGTLEENISTMAFRKGYIDQAELQVDKLTQRALYRFSIPHASFASEGVIVFNSLSWARDAVVELSFKEGRKLNFEIIDLAAGDTIPCYAKGHKVWFIARNLPSLGYKKYRLAPALEPDRHKATDLIMTGNSIENRFYRINYDKKTNAVLQITDKRTRWNLIGKTDFYGFAQPVVKQGTQHAGFKTVNQGNPHLTVIDERPVRLALRIEYENGLFESTEFVLWSDMAQIDLCQTLDLTRLPETDVVEEYGLAFPFEIKKGKAEIEIIGGYLRPDADRLPGKDHNAFSIRRTVALSDRSSSLLWASKDRRVLRLEYDNKRPVLISNVVNNFPKQWNRRQDNSGRLKLNYSFTYSREAFNPGLATRFGWEALTPVLTQKGWFSTDQVKKQYFELDNDQIVLLDLQVDDSGDSWTMELLNSNLTKTQTVTISSEFLKSKNIRVVDFLGNSTQNINSTANKIQVDIKPNKILLLLIQGQ
ncbi:MAG: hypothetical protein J7L22_07180 [Candidatus Marinimicrobia bacterium]|nr:hypothetical protein [Candidatus Neomarinimicrobiota bacterium]